MTTDVVRRQPARLPGGAWRALLTLAFLLIDELSTRGLSDPFWTLGGGTVLMFRYPETNVIFTGIQSKKPRSNDRG